MKSAVLNYFFLKELLNEVPEDYTRDIDKSNSLIFNYSNFLFVSSYSYVYNLFLKDKYNVGPKITENFDAFLTECAINLGEKNDYKRLLFLYGIISTYSLHEVLDPKMEGLKDKTETMDDVYNMLDVYHAKKENLDLTKVSLYHIFPNSYTYTDFMDDLIHLPLVHTINFMGSRGYFRKSYKRFRFYARFNSKGIWHKPFFFLWDKIVARHKPGKKYFLYTNHVNTNLIILSKKGKIHKNELKNADEEMKSSIDYIWLQAKMNALERIDALNDYLFHHSDRKFRDIFHVDKKKVI